MATPSEYRREIAALLIERGYDWVVEQVEAEIASGKPSSKVVRETEVFDSDEVTFSVRAPRQRRASFVASEPYSETERLEILLRALERAISERAQLENVLTEELGHFPILYMPDALEEDPDAQSRGKPHELNRSNASQRANLMEKARRLAQEVREDADGRS